MKTVSLVIVLALLTVVPAARAADPHKKSAAGKPQTVTVAADEVKWGDAPPTLPKGAKVGVLFGDPSKKGTFAIRLKAPDGYKLPPHWHTQDEQLTIIAGTLVMHTGDTWEAPSHDLGTGAYHFLPGKAHHAAEAKGETVIQINGKGPFDIHYLNPADDPTKSAAAGK
jgi:hypothetical protein